MAALSSSTLPADSRLHDAFAKLPLQFEKNGRQADAADHIFGKDGRLEYDFVHAPGDDPSTIRLGPNGATPRVDSNGTLVLKAGSND